MQLKAMNIYLPGRGFLQRKSSAGAPRSGPIPFESWNVHAANTEEEVREIAEDSSRKSDLHSVNYRYFQTSNTRRVRTIWHKLVGSDPRIIVRYATDDPYDGAHWWRHTQDGLDVVRENLGMLNAWAGFPLRPTQN